MKDAKTTIQPQPPSGGTGMSHSSSSGSSESRRSAAATAPFFASIAAGVPFAVPVAMAALLPESMAMRRRRHYHRARSGRHLTTGPRPISWPAALRRRAGPRRSRGAGRYPDYDRPSADDGAAAAQNERLRWPPGDTSTPLGASRCPRLAAGARGLIVRSLGHSGVVGQIVPCCMIAEQVRLCLSLQRIHVPLGVTTIIFKTTKRYVIDFACNRFCTKSCVFIDEIGIC